MRCWLWIGTQTLPSGATDSAYGWGPVFTYRTALVAASTMATPLPEKSSSYIEAYTWEPSLLTATNRGVCVSPIEVTFREATSITDRMCECWLATYTVWLSGATTTPWGSVPTLIEDCTAGRSALTSTGRDALGEPADDGADSTGGRLAVDSLWPRRTAANATPPPTSTISATRAATSTGQRRTPPVRDAATAGTGGAAAPVRNAAATSCAPSPGGTISPVAGQAGSGTSGA